MTLLSKYGKKILDGFRKEVKTLQKTPIWIFPVPQWHVRVTSRCRRSIFEKLLQSPAGSERGSLHHRMRDVATWAQEPFAKLCVAKCSGHWKKTTTERKRKTFEKQKRSIWLIVASDYYWQQLSSWSICDTGHSRMSRCCFLDLKTTYLLPV